MSKKINNTKNFCYRKLLVPIIVGTKDKNNLYQLFLLIQTLVPLNILIKYTKGQ